MNANEVVERLKAAENGLGHLAMVVDMQYGSAIAAARMAMVNAWNVIEDQDTTIRAMMGEYGDSCDVKEAGARGCEDG